MLSNGWLDIQPVHMEKYNFTWRYIWRNLQDVQLRGYHDKVITDKFWIPNFRSDFSFLKHTFKKRFFHLFTMVPIVPLLCLNVWYILKNWYLLVLNHIFVHILNFQFRHFLYFNAKSVCFLCLGFYTFVLQYIVSSSTSRTLQKNYRHSRVMDFAYFNQPVKLFGNLEGSPGMYRCLF